MDKNEIDVFRGYLAARGSTPPSVLFQLLEELTPEDRAKLKSAAAEGYMGLELERLKMQDRFLVSRAELDDFIAKVKELDALPTPLTSLSRTEISKRIKGASGETVVSHRRGCFVASFAYADPLHADVQLLRCFRHAFLESYATGRCFSAWYYSNGQSLAQIATHFHLRKPSRAALWFLCRIIEGWMRFTKRSNFD
jgi:hypothetical protein